MLGTMFDMCYPRLMTALQVLERKWGNPKTEGAREDLAATAIGVAYAKLADRDHDTPGDLREPFSYLLRCCAYAVVDELKADKRYHARFIDELEEGLQPLTTTYILLEDRVKRFRILRRVRESLRSDLQWDIVKLWLRNAGEISAKEMAEFLRKDPSAISRSRKGAIRLLRERYPELREILQVY